MSVRTDALHDCATLVSFFFFSRATPRRAALLLALERHERVVAAKDNVELLGVDAVNERADLGKVGTRGLRRVGHLLGLSIPRRSATAMIAHPHGSMACIFIRRARGRCAAARRTLTRL